MFLPKVTNKQDGWASFYLRFWICLKNRCDLSRKRNMTYTCHPCVPVPQAAVWPCSRHSEACEVAGIRGTWLRSCECWVHCWGPVMGEAWPQFWRWLAAQPLVHMRLLAVSIWQSWVSSEAVHQFGGSSNNISRQSNFWFGYQQIQEASLQFAGLVMKKTKNS